MCPTRRPRRPLSRPDRPRFASRPGVEPLEGRALLATSAFDPGFGQGGLVLADQGGTGSAGAGTSVAVQADGKVVVLGSEHGSGGYSLVVARYDADGSADATFGSGGVVTLPEPAGANGGGSSGSFTPGGLLIQGDGKFVVSAAYVPPAPASGTAQTVATEILRLEPDGQLDATFGRAGTAILATEDQDFTSLALQADGKIVAAGSVTPSGSEDIPSYLLAAERLDADGAPDPTFGTGGLFIAPTPYPYSYESTGPASAVAIDPSSGKIVLATILYLGLASEDEQTDAEAIRLGTDGTPDASFGYGGYISVDAISFGEALAVQPDGKILIGGENNGNVTAPSGSALVRLDSDGSVDPTFTADFAGLGAAPPILSSLAVQPDGKILVGGTPERTTSSFGVARFNADGSRDVNFGVAGEQSFGVSVPTLSSGETSYFSVYSTEAGVAVAPDGKIVVAGTVDLAMDGQTVESVESVLARLLPVAVNRTVPGDYTGAGKSDPAVYLPALDLYAYRPSSGAADVVQQFGIPGAGQTVPAPGDYSGDGTTDVAVYLPSAGEFAIRPSSGGADRIVPFGFAGAGQTIPAVGDYNGDGVADIAAYLPAIASFAIRPSSGGPDEIVPFGFAGAGQTIPAPGDYDGDGKADIAAYLPAIASFAIRPSSGGADEIIPFGMAGVGASIPVPGDYDGSGKTELAVYLPSLGELIYRPAGGGADVAVPFGLAGAGATIPAPGDYDGDGKTDVAAYLPSLGIFAYRPSGGGADVLESFGSAGPGATIPASSLPGAIPGTLTAASVPAASVSSRSEVIVPLTDDLMAIPGQAKRKSSGAG